MAVSPSDFELYSRVTGRPVPTDRGARMKMAPEVNRFIKNREYERPQKTTLQKGADFLGKAALLGGALAAGHAIGGGFRGNTAENVGKVADVVQNLAKTGVVGAEGGAGKPDTRIVDEWLNSPGNSSFVEYENAAKAATEMAPLSNEIYGALQQEEMLNNLAQDTVLPAQPEGSAQIVSARDKTDDFLSKLLPAPVRPEVSGEQLPTNAFDVPVEAWDPKTRIVKGEKQVVRPSLLSEAEKQMQAEKIYGDKLTKAERVPLHRQYSTIQSDQKQPDYPAEGSTQEAVDNFLRNRYQESTISSLGGSNVGLGTPLPLNDGGMEGGGGDLAPIAPDEGGFRGTYVRDDQLATTSDSNIQQKVGGFLSGQRNIGANVLDTISKQGGGRDLRQSAPGLVAAITGRGLVPNTGGGLLKGSGTGFGRNVVGGFWDAAGNFVRRDPIVDGAVRGLEGLGNMNVFGHSVADAAGSAFNAVPGLSDAVNLGGVKLAELGLLGGGVVLDSAVKDTLKLGVDARRFAENRFGFRPLSWQETAVQTGDLIDQGWARDEAAKVAARNNPLLAEGMSRHDEAIGSLQKNIQAVLPTTVPTGQVAIGEDHQLTRTPKLQPSDTTIQVPSRAIQQFSDRRISGEGSLTPGDRSDLNALLSSSQGQYGPIEGLKALGPDETVSGDMEIRTDVGVDDPVNFTQLFGKRMGRGEKANFVAGLQERNKDIYSGASDLPARKVGGRGKIGTSGEAATMAGKLEYPSRDAQDPLHGVKEFAAGLMEEPDLSDNAAKEVGRRMAEREEQGSTEWVRSPDGKLRRKKIDDPWDS